MNKKKEFILKMGKETGSIIVILTVGIFTGFLMLCLVHLLPVDRMYKNVLASKDIINSHAQIIPGYKSTEVDNYTDSIMLNEAICPVEAPLIERVVNNYQVNFYQDYTQQENLLRYLEGGEGYRYQGYSHYWGGHQVLLKILLLRFDYSDILVGNVFLQMLLIVLIVSGLCRTEKQYFIVPYTAAVLSMMPMTIALCIQYCAVFYITLIGSAVIVWKSKDIGTTKMYLLFLLLGMMTSYFDFLTYPLVSLGIPLITALIYAENDKTLMRIFFIIKNSFAWWVGYLGMWGGKWVLGSVLCPESGSLEVAIGSIRYRGSNMAEGMAISTFDVLLKNMFIFLRLPVILMLGIACFFFILKSIRNRTLRREKIIQCIPYILICFYPIIWYLIAKNHSYEHSFMAYRELAISVLAGLGMVARLSERA